ncbi:MAG: hypothetical protein XD52_0334 [bacterium 42_11]|nr:MAG: hypothetical protein XD52_0334 [bacterium 42_11]
MRSHWVFIFLGILLIMEASASALEILLNYPLHEVLEADLSPGGGLLATAHPGNFIEIRSLKPFYLDGRLYSEKRDEIERLCFIDENRLLAVRREGIELWERKGIKRWSLEARLHREPETPVSYEQDLIAFMPSYEEIKIYEAKNKEEILTIRETLFDVKDLSLSKNGETLFVILKTGEVLAYPIKERGEPIELGKIKDYIDIEEGKVLFLNGRRARIADIGTSSTLHEIRLKGRCEKGVLKGRYLLLLSEKGKGYLYKLKEGDYHLEREITKPKKKLKIHEKGLLSWDEEGITLNDEIIASTFNPLKIQSFALEGEKLAEVGENFAVVWDLRSFSPELFFEGKVILKEGKLYLKDREGYICYDLRSEESSEVKSIKEEGETVLDKERLILKKEGLYDMDTEERLLDLRGKKFFPFKNLSFLVILEREELFIYNLKGRIAERIKLPYKEAFANEEKGLIALLYPNEPGFILFDIKGKREKEAIEEKLGKVKEVSFFGDNILAIGENGLSIFNEEGEALHFEELKGIEKVIKVDENRALLSCRDGTLWLYSVKRRRPLVYHDLNGIVKSACLKDDKILALLETGELYILPSNNVRPWLCFLLFSRDNWIIISSENYFNSSLQAQTNVFWLDGKSIYVGERFIGKYKGPRGLRRIWNEL